MNSKKKILWISVLMMISLVFFSVSQTQAALIWSENFNTEDPAGWTFENWQRPSNIFEVNPDLGMSVINGVLRGPNSTSHDSMASVNYDSSVAYGNWSFDWIVTSGTDHLAYDSVAFMFTDTVNNYNMTGLTESEYLENCNGYNLLMISSSSTTGFTGAAIPGISLGIYGSSYAILDTHEFASDIVGSHHIDIYRDMQGQISVYFDTQLIIQATDNTVTTSEVFNIVSFKGDSGFDNIVVNELSDETTTPPTTTTDEQTTTTTGTNTSESTEGFIGWLLIPASFLLILSRKKKNL